MQEKAISIHTIGYRIKGKPGSWFVEDVAEVEGKKFFLMESEDYGTEIPYIVISESGEAVIDPCYVGLGDRERQKIRYFLEAKKSGLKPTGAKVKGSGNRRSVLARLREKQKIVEETRRQTGLHN
ncbi:MAG: hypothetical protein IJ679_08820 [Lachnospiraceae bacterium]|nr:hypothetical protein [Lachnospiraceae bacterium]